MKTSNRNYEQSVVEEQEYEDILKNIWRLEDCDMRIKYSQEMIKHWQRLLKTTMDEKNDLLNKSGLT